MYLTHFGGHVMILSQITYLSLIAPLLLSTSSRGISGFLAAKCFTIFLVAA